MAVWVDCHSAPAYFSGYGCDMGPYIGPWPLLPPGELTGLSGDEIDFYVALPNPVDTTDVTIAADGTYDTPIWDSWRYETGSTPPTNFGYQGDSTGPSAPFPVPGTMPAGAHLYVVVLTFTPPSNPPEFYVPASYAAGGSAAFETAMGHWSTDQSPFDRATTAPGIFGSGGGYAVNGSVSFAHDVNVNTEEDSLLATLMSAASTSAAATARIWPAKSGGNSVIKLDAQSDFLGYDLTSRLDLTGGIAFPDLLDTLIYDQDYSESPYVDAGGNAGPMFVFDDPATFVFGSPDFTGGNTSGTSLGGTMPPDYTDFDVPIRFGWLTADPVTPALTYAGTTVGDFNMFPGGATLDTVDLSPITDPRIYLYWGPTFLYTGATGATDFAMVLGEADYVRQVSVAANHPYLPATVSFSTWQYWVPGDIVPTTPKWHTIAGSWASISGAPMAIFTPGLGPVEYADGPA